jgi:aminoglycoside phosphotransferase family enzyme
MNTEAMIEALKNPNAYPENTSGVKLVQTHISWVFICDNFVYKVKKPVNFGFLDFSTLEKRKHYCHQEVELNRRLAKDIYIGVYPIVGEKGTYRISTEPDADSPVAPVEYAVKMKLIPDEVVLKHKFKAGDLTEQDIGRAAKAIADFHKSAGASDEISKYGSLDTVKFNTDENFQQTEKYIGASITQERFDTLRQWTDEFYAQNAELFQKRIVGGHVRDCHGDLHMEHICLTEPITIIDCIEFNERFRYSDTASDLAFLLMDLEYHSGQHFAELLLDSYTSFSGETSVELELILKYYKIYRAYVRGKVNSFQLDDTNISPEKKEEARKTAQNYFDLAYSYIKN